jgi:hypothetical protein
VDDRRNRLSIRLPLEQPGRRGGVIPPVPWPGIATHQPCCRQDPCHGCLFPRGGLPAAAGPIARHSSLTDRRLSGRSRCKESLIRQATANRLGETTGAAAERRSDAVLLAKAEGCRRHPQQTLPRPAEPSGGGAWLIDTQQGRCYHGAVGGRRRSEASLQTRPGAHGGHRWSTFKWTSRSKRHSR